MGQDLTAVNRDCTSCESVPLLTLWRPNRGIVYYDKRDLERATRDMNRATKLNPSFSTALRDRGIDSYDKRDFDGTLAAAFGSKPSFTVSFNAQAASYENRREGDRIIQKSRPSRCARSPSSVNGAAAEPAHANAPAPVGNAAAGARYAAGGCADPWREARGEAAYAEGAGRPHRKAQCADAGAAAPSLPAQAACAPAATAALAPRRAQPRFCRGARTAPASARAIVLPSITSTGPGRFAAASLRGNSPIAACSAC